MKNIDNQSASHSSEIIQLILRRSQDGFAPRTFLDIYDVVWVKTNKSFILSSFKDGSIKNSMKSDISNFYSR
ncbi:hypothetical protein Glove_346g40 [Diversispora epigaea]|uniref:Uncharacterized protein n=1 Tax=Diversispora epigaea TaxID=1348612 RepID=A0A397HJM6_9GLOM|nr:hypothetical protein Glove_346g40 [Diversispora epigaea]